MSSSPRKKLEEALRLADDLSDERQPNLISDSPSHLCPLANSVSVQVAEQVQFPLESGIPDKLRCPTCGIAHRNPKLVDAYRYCHYCKRVLRQPDEIIGAQIIRPETPGNRPQTAGFRPQTGQRPLTAPKKRITILIATFGHPVDASRAIDVTRTLRKLVGENPENDQLYISSEENLIALFGENPCPGETKCLKVRYHINHLRAEIQRFESDKEGYLKSPFCLKVPKTEPKLIIYSATYGHPHGAAASRGLFNVTEQIQGFADQSGCEYLEIGTDLSLDDVFGNPAPGVQKIFQVEYEILGSSGMVRKFEAHGHLLEDICIQSAPLVAPLFLVLEATYGFTAEIVASRIIDIQKQLYKLQLIQEKKSSGRAITLDQNKSLHDRTELEEELSLLHTITPSYLDVRDIVQKLVDDGGGYEMKLTPDMDLNAIFGDPKPGVMKALTIKYDVRGLGGVGDCNETTKTGQQKNYVLQRRGTFLDEVPSSGHLTKEVVLSAQKVLPVLEITNATFGHPQNHAKTFDVTERAALNVYQNGGNCFQLTKGDDLVAMFKDPCRGVRKVLDIRYITRGLAGNMAIEEKNGYLIASLRLGYERTKQDSSQKCNQSSKTERLEGDQEKPQDAKADILEV